MVPSHSKVPDTSASEPGGQGGWHRAYRLIVSPSTWSPMAAIAALNSSVYE
jgi:hypothetical protein